MQKKLVGTTALALLLSITSFKVQASSYYLEDDDFMSLPSGKAVQIELDDIIMQTPLQKSTNLPQNQVPQPFFSPVENDHSALISLLASSTVMEAQQKKAIKIALPQLQDNPLNLNVVPLPPVVPIQMAQPQEPDVVPEVNIEEEQVPLPAVLPAQVAQPQEPDVVPEVNIEEEQVPLPAVLPAQMAQPQEPDVVPEVNIEEEQVPLPAVLPAQVAQPQKPDVALEENVEEVQIPLPPVLPLQMAQPEELDVVPQEDIEEDDAFKNLGNFFDEEEEMKIIPPAPSDDEEEEMKIIPPAPSDDEEEEMKI
ncbi:MAG: hypothetical protein J0H12_07590, partial [Candidatus Paracaedimonas acanthamoebae]|nr:hypothetical protein [Candidatus Paracaedimonas acanthamoebae]